MSNLGIAFASTLVDQWVRLGVRHAVISPGSRSTPLAVACLSHEGLAVHVHHDERSASFIALGIGRATGRPAVVVTTSGTATTHLHGAVVEAFQAGVPMLVATADRPPELQGVGAPQTIDQRDLFGRAVRWFVEPGPPTVEGRGHWRRLASDAFAATLGTPPGPVHLNLAFREPLVGPDGSGVAMEPPPDDADDRGGVAMRWQPPDEVLLRFLGSGSGSGGGGGGSSSSSSSVSGSGRGTGSGRRSESTGRRGLIVAGDRAVRSDAERSALLELSDHLGWPLVADPLSGVRTSDPHVVTHADPLLRSPTFAATRPELVLRVGGLPASRILNEWLARSGAAQVGIDRWGLVPDPDRVLGASLHADVEATARALIRLTQRADDRTWLDRWSAGERLADEAIAANLVGEPAVVAAATRVARRCGAALVVSSSMPVRDLEWFGPPLDGVAVHSNRGANGIDGVISTAIGVALGGGRTVAIIGDVATLHDSTAWIGLSRRPVDLCVVVIDNDGGGIFSFLPQARELSGDDFETLFATPHGADIAALVGAHGVPVERVAVDDTAGLDAAVRRWERCGGVAAIVVDSSRAANVSVHSRLFAAVAAAVHDAGGAAGGGGVTGGGAAGGGGVTGA